MNNPDGLIDLLVSHDPQQQGQRVLGRLISSVQAKGGAILIPSEDGARAWIALNVQSVGSVLEKWDATVKALMPAGSRTARGITTALLRSPQGRIVGMLYLEEAQAFDAVRHAGFLEAFASAVSFAGTTTAQAYSVDDVIQARGARGNGEALKNVVIRVLDHHEWNLARAARELHCTRRTLYQRLGRWGIARQKVAKSPT